MLPSAVRAVEFSMRPLLVLLAVLSLAVRWADAGCGCAQHNGWFVLAAGHADGHDGHADEPPGPAFEHGCDGGCGRAAYPAGPRVLPMGGAAILTSVAVSEASPSPCPADVAARVSPPG